MKTNSAHSANAEKTLGLEIPGRVTASRGQGNLPTIEVATPWSKATLYLNGAQITHFQKNGEPPLLFLSRKSVFAAGKAIRGGVPICFPWFGSREGQPAHGFARITEWELTSTAASPEGVVTLHLRLPLAGLPPAWSGLRTEFIVTVGETLTMELIAGNGSPNETLEIENCLHTYFHVGNISQVSVTGLQGAYYLDNAADGGGMRQQDKDAALKIVKETNRIYEEAAADLTIRDESLKRVIHVQKTHSHSTVVWNPWTTQIMSDFDPAEHQQMICVEAGNVKRSQVPLAPGGSASLRVQLSTAPWQ